MYRLLPGMLMSTVSMVYYDYTKKRLTPIGTTYSAIICGVTWPISLPVLVLCLKN